MQHAHRQQMQSTTSSKCHAISLSGVGPCIRCSAAASVGSPIPTSASPSIAKAKTHDQVQAQAAFHANIQHLVSVSSRPGTELCAAEDPVEIARLALLQSSSQRRFARTHLNTINLSATVDDAEDSQHLRLSQLAFKALLRASLTAARLNHAYLTTPHITLGLLSTAANSPGSPLAAAAADQYAAAEAAVIAMIDGPYCQLPAAVGAAVSLSGQTRGLDVVTWCRDLSDPARRVLRAAEQLRQQHGHDLITSKHLLLALLQDATDSSGSGSSRCEQLFSGLGLSSQDIVQQLQQQLEQQQLSTSDEDAVACQPVGFLHEEFFSNVCRSVTTAQSNICLN